MDSVRTKQKMSSKLRWWLDSLKDNLVIQKKQEDFQHSFDRCFKANDRLLEDENFRACDRVAFAGQTVGGEREGRGVVSGFLSKDPNAPVVVSLRGFFHGDRLVGSVSVLKKHNVLDGDEEEEEEEELCFCKRGVRHGFSRTLLRKKGTPDVLIAFGKYLNGVHAGFWWERTEGGAGFLVRRFDDDDDTLATRGAFIYCDLSTALAGDWRGREMARARQAAVREVAWEGGVAFPILTTVETDDHSVYRSGEPFPTSNPRLRDPYESSWVAVRESGQGEARGAAGEGLFARREMTAGQVAAFFNGVRRRAGEDEAANRDYAIALKEEGLILDIPAGLRSTSQYAATLGHKVCHSFSPNAAYSSAWHPRFGLVRCVVCLRSVVAGEELTCDYKYALDKDPPEWYVGALKRHLRRTGLDPGTIEDTIAHLQNRNRHGMSHNEGREVAG